jgi:hypothetical protein
MIDKWREFITSDPLGKVWWYNLQFDMSQNNLPSDIHQKFLSAIQQFLKANIENSPPLDTLVRALGEPPVLFSLQGLRAPDLEPLSRVVDAHSFAHFNVRYERMGLGTSETLKDVIWGMFKNGDIIPKRHFSGELRSGRSLFWGTPTRCLEPLCEGQEVGPNEYAVHPPEKGDIVATEIRNLLGLSYINEGVGLYRIDIPIEFLERVKVCAPTTLDSSPRCVFLPADETTRYGWTLHLSKMDTGAEEVVVEPMEFTSEFKVTQIGFVRGPLPNEKDVWEALAKIVEGRYAKRNSSRDE